MRGAAGLYRRGGMGYRKGGMEKGGGGVFLSDISMCGRDVETPIFFSRSCPVRVFVDWIFGVKCFGGTRFMSGTTPSFCGVIGLIYRLRWPAG